MTSCSSVCFVLLRKTCSSWTTSWSSTLHSCAFSQIQSGFLDVAHLSPTFRRRSSSSLRGPYFSSSFDLQVLLLAVVPFQASDCCRLPHAQSTWIAVADALSGLHAILFVVACSTAWVILTCRCKTDRSQILHAAYDSPAGSTENFTGTLQTIEHRSLVTLISYCSSHFLDCARSDLPLPDTTHACNRCKRSGEVSYPCVSAVWHSGLG